MREVRRLVEVVDFGQSELASDGVAERGVEVTPSGGDEGHALLHAVPPRLLGEAVRDSNSSPADHDVDDGVVGHADHEVASAPLFTAHGWIEPLELRKGAEYECPP